MLLSAFDRAQYDYNRDIIKHWSNLTLSRGYIHTERSCFTYHPVLLNARVEPHIDKNDTLSGMVAMTCVGDFTGGGNVIIPLFGRQYAMRPGDVMFLRASLIEHWITAYEGQRYSFVHAVSENMNKTENLNPPEYNSRKSFKESTKKRKAAEVEAAEADPENAERAGKKAKVEKGKKPEIKATA